MPEEVYVLGHKITDVDSMVSGVLLAELLRWQGVSGAEFVLLHPLDAITESVRVRLSIPTPRLLPNSDTLSGKQVFLVDHSHPDESVGRDVSVRVVGIIDHHTDSGYLCADKTVRPVGCAALLVYERMIRCGFPNVETDRRIVMMALTALAIDTAVCMKQSVTDQDRAMLRRWSELVGVSDAELKRTCLFEIDLHDAVAAASNARKDFTLGIGAHRVRTSYVEVLTDEPWKDAAVANAVAVLEREMARPECELELGLFVVRYFQWNKTVAYAVGRMAHNVLNGRLYLEYKGIYLRTAVVDEVRAMLDSLDSAAAGK